VFGVKYVEKLAFILRKDDSLNSTTLNLTDLAPILAQAAPTTEAMISPEVALFMALPKPYHRDQRVFRSLIVAKSGACYVFEQNVTVLFNHLQQRLLPQAVMKLLAHQRGFHQRIPYVVGTEAYLSFNTNPRQIWLCGHQIDSYRNHQKKMIVRLLSGLTLQLPSDITPCKFKTQIVRAIDLMYFELMRLRGRVTFFKGFYLAASDEAQGHILRHALLRNETCECYQKCTLKKWAAIATITINLCTEEDEVASRAYRQRLEKMIHPAIRKEWWDELQQWLAEGALD
jgi:hypothetical protein